VAALLPAAPCGAPDVAPEQPAGPTPFERPELPDDAGPVPGVEPIVEGAFVLEPLEFVLEPLEFMLPELVPPDAPEVVADPPAAPPAPPALCARAAPQTSENTAVEASKIRLI
jgi:hypothetical protein